ncbi:MAG: primosomal protein N' [Lachnospiraceae bacterium]|nr:primosomal protein N' [Lachnospiraceae bacterium]
MRYADVIVDISQGKLDRTFQYRVPDELEGRVAVGSSVTVPFGKGARTIKGFVLSFSVEAKVDESRIKDVLGVNDKDLRIEDKMIALACFIRESFGGTLNEALKTVMPVKKAVKQRVKKTIVMSPDEEKVVQALETARQKKHRARERVLQELLNDRSLDYDTVVEKLAVSSQTIRSLEEMGLIEIVERKDLRNPVFAKGREEEKITPNPAQRYIIDEITADIKARKTGAYLIHGVTGSGKTYVYMSVIEEVLKQGKQVIMLIPEIALTYQTVMRFYRRFGDRISILNSRMSAGERYDQSMRAKNGEIDIMIGPRSALFTPFERLGLIIMDEEHEESYKNENVPHYNAREVALMRGRTEGASVIFGSATPSLEVYSKVESGKVRLFELKERAGGAAKPFIHVVDMREELKNKNRDIFSVKLKELIEDRLKKGELTMLFLNRRGYSGFVSCRSCGEIIKCPHCDVSLTRHRNGEMICHYCGYVKQPVDKCPSCGSPYIGSFGIGTEKIEEKLKALFPTARVLRMDADTTGGKEGHSQILASFADGEADILVGTQMIVKGHDFHKVTLVGILAADMSLGVPDYRAAERTFDLLVQASGRAGRGKTEGEVVIQTYQPEHYSVKAAANADFHAFYEEEMGFRRAMEYPPASNMLLILCASAKEKEAKDYAEYVAGLAGKAAGELAKTGAKLIGPARASLYKANDIYRRALYIKSANMEELIRIKNFLADTLTGDRKYPGASCAFDFNPQRV